MRAMTNLLCLFVSKFLPSAYVLSLSLTLIVFVCAITMTPMSFMGAVTSFGVGMTSLLSFTMQMVLVLVTGHILANAPVVKRLLSRIARIPKTKNQAIIVIGMAGLACTYLNWGFGMVGGAIVAREVAKTMKGKHLHYPLLIAACYGGNILRGPSSSVPLEVAGANSIVKDIIGGSIPISATLYSWWNLLISLLLVVVLPIVFIMMIPDDKDSIELDSRIIEAEEEAERKRAEADAANRANMTLADRLGQSSILGAVVALIVTIYLVNYFVEKRTLNFGLNEVSLFFFAVGAWAHKTPENYSRAMGEAIKTAGGITLQFMFYAAIMRMMRDSGLAKMLANWFCSFANAQTLPFWTFISAGVLNLFIPSGGGQWSVQGPIMMDAAMNLNADTAKVAMAICWGDSWTNQIQPFWALASLAIAGLTIKDIMGYCFMWAIISGVIIGGCFWIL